MNENMYKFWYDYMKPKYQNKAKIYYMNTDSFTIYIKTKDVYGDIADDVDKKLIHQIMKSIGHFLQERIKM